MTDKPSSTHLEEALARLATRIDGLESANKSALTGIENRLNNYDFMQKASASRLEDVYKSFMDRLTTRDDTVQLMKDMSGSIQKRSDDILHQLGLRFNFITGMTGFIALAFAASFSYNIFQVAQVNEAKSFLEDGTEILTSDAIKYSSVLSGLAHADALATQGDREFLRSNYSDSMSMATEAIKYLEPLLDKTGVAKSELLDATIYRPSSCERVGNVSAPRGRLSPDRALKSKAVEERFRGLGPTSLRPAVEESLFSAYDLHARAVFFAKGKDVNVIRQDGEILLALGSTKWQGYHWIGLASEGTTTDNTEARTCFEHSVTYKPIANKDHINLAELLFIEGHYDQATSQAKKYIEPEFDRFGSPTDVVAQFYIIASNLLSKKMQPGVKGPDFFLTSLGKLPNLNLEGTFLSQDLERALDESRSEGQSFAAQDGPKKDQVRKMKVCLMIHSKCEI